MNYNIGRSNRTLSSTVSDSPELLGFDSVSILFKHCFLQTPDLFFPGFPEVF